MDTSEGSEKKPCVLVVDSDPDRRQSTASIVRSLLWSVETADDGMEAMEILGKSHIGAVLTELQMPRMNGTELLNRLSTRQNSPPVIVFTQNGGMELGLRCVHELGAFWYLEQPVKKGTLQIVINAAINTFTAIQAGPVSTPFGLVGESHSINGIRSLIEKIAERDVTVLITGETGTGKELAARAIHHASSRANGPLVSVNCAAVSEGLLEPEFFGYEKGAFTGAISRRMGYFEQAHNGTVLLDEIDHLPVQFQAKLLRALGDHKIRRVGGATDLEFSFRVLVSTNNPAEKHGLRPDLFYRIERFHLHMPPLREHAEDIERLTEHFLRELNRQHETSVVRVAPEVANFLARYSWPGNVRQLRNVLEEAVIRADPAREIIFEHLPESLRNDQSRILRIEAPVNAPPHQP